jgi:hypothetical protein
MDARPKSFRIRGRNARPERDGEFWIFGFQFSVLSRNNAVESAEERRLTQMKEGGVGNLCGKRNALFSEPL